MRNAQSAETCERTSMVEPAGNAEVQVKPCNAHTPREEQVRVPLRES